MNYIEIENEMKRTYNAIANQYEKEAKEDWKNKKIVDEFLKYLNKNDTVLDIACGTGELLKYYESKDLKTYGIDISKNMIEIAKRKAPNSTIITKSVYEINKINKKFDGISSTFTLVHIPKEKINDFINNVRSILNDNGIFFILFTTNLKEGLQKEPLNSNYNYYVVNYSNKEIINILKNNGFEILKSGTDVINNLKVGLVIARKKL